MAMIHTVRHGCVRDASSRQPCDASSAHHTLFTAVGRGVRGWAGMHVVPMDDVVMRCHTMDCSKEEGCDDALLWIVWMEICEGAKLRKDVSAGSPTRSWFSIVKRCEKVYA
eukprot:TRINITY_DN11544_c0_g1_i3.p1 TRINITY_DN11544_c0_g1~~TRINITY_DN11544_c0_g1_i3.p1  ORF type:complete len:111 (+),score=1.19 TRINITY_DN11544_c0_g1_i3:113-445(+)